MNESISAVQQTPVKPARLPSRFMASLYLPIGILVILGAGAFDVDPVAQYLIGIAAELIIALIALAFIKLEKLPLKATLRLQLKDWRHLAAGVLAVPGMWFIGIIGNIIMSFVLGYITPVPPSFYPSNLLEFALFAFSAVIIAPICEEIIFRGYVQRAFERKSPWMAILLGGTVFAMYHLRFQGLFAILPIAYAMSYFAWRSDSIYVSMLMHAVFNSFATVFMVLNLTVPMLIMGIVILLFLAIAFILLPGAGVAVLWFRNQYPLSKMTYAPQTYRTWTSYLWLIPLIVFLLGYGYFATNEYLYMQYPENRAEPEIELEAYTSLPQDLSLEYEVLGIWESTVGRATCTRTSVQDQIHVTCSGSVDETPMFGDYDLDFLEDMAPMTPVAHSWEQTSIWSADLDLLETQLDWESMETASGLKLQIDGSFIVNNDDGEMLSNGTIPVSPTLVLGEFPWRLQQLPLEMGEVYQTPVLIRDNQQGQYQLQTALVSVDGAEPLWTSLGHYTAWKITVSYVDELGEDQILGVWYDAENPDYPLKFNNGDAEFVLKSVTVLDP